jgi:hypothetical protein
MKYVFLAYQNERQWAALSASQRDELEKARQAIEQDLRQGGRLFAVENPQGGPAGITVRVASGGQVSLADGPAAEARGQLIRIYFVNARDLNEAIRVAATMPQARCGPIEIRSLEEIDWPPQSR